MEPAEKTTKQGVRDLNAFGPKKKKSVIGVVQEKKQDETIAVEVQQSATTEKPA